LSPAHIGDLAQKRGVLGLGQVFRLLRLGCRVLLLDLLRLLRLLRGVLFRLALLLGIDPLLDMGRSATNVVGNSVATAVVSKWENALENPDSGD
jgi:Na+/H+-dicarboxylate symporter